MSPEFHKSMHDDHLLESVFWGTVNSLFFAPGLTIALSERIKDLIMRKKGEQMQQVPEVVMVLVGIIGIMCLEFKFLANPKPSFETEQTFDNRYNRNQIPLHR